jgi:YkoY family integral membrane protein
METSTILIILNLIILESLLSIDNAAVLAVMVKDLPGKQKQRALRYGLIGAYVFRGICLFVATWLVKVIWLKIAGGAYLVYLAVGHFTPKKDTLEETAKTGNNSKIFRWAQKNFKLSAFWATVILVEMMDLAFSIDNVFAAVALSDNFWIIMAGVAIGILAMRFVAGKFVVLMDKYPSLGTSAYTVIALLGLKLVLSGVLHYVSGYDSIRGALDSHEFDLWFSGSMMLIFFLPLLGRKKTTPNAYNSNNL